MNPKKTGILLHLTSLPEGDSGDLGQQAYDFAVWLNKESFKIWQLLPLVPPGGPHFCPYSTWSAFCGSPWLVDLQTLAQWGLIPTELVQNSLKSTGVLNFTAMMARRWPILEKAALCFLHNVSHFLKQEWQDFFHDNQDWLVDASTFAVCQDHLQRPWWQWPDPLKHRDNLTLQGFQKEFSEKIAVHQIIQFFFFKQLKNLRLYCESLGITLMGDLAFYVDADSADVWSKPHLFKVDPVTGMPTFISGVPPDDFSPDTGQVWGTPTYDWAAMEQEQFAWWRRRFHVIRQQTPLVRLDHFVALNAYWEIPGGSTTAKHGQWQPGPGSKLLQAFCEDVGGTLPIVAEDLGIIDDNVHHLRDQFHLPGMNILQFAFSTDLTNPYLPHNHRANSVTYTGTHDNNTTWGWWQEQSQHTQDFILDYIGFPQFKTQEFKDDTEKARTLIQKILASLDKSTSHTIIIPMQDWLGLDASHRMNVPGTGPGNWIWRLKI